MGKNNCFSNINAVVFLPLLPCVNTHLNAPDHQAAKTSDFLEVVTLDDEHFIKHI